MTRTRWLAGVGVGVLVLLALAACLVGPFAYGRLFGFGNGILGFRMMRGFGFPFGLMGGLGMLLFWLLVIGGIIWLVAGTGRAGMTPSLAPRETPLDILKARYARGEITKDQFEEMKRDLSA